MKNRQQNRRTGPIWLAWLVFGLLLLGTAAGHADLPAATLVDGATVDGTVRVRLASLGTPAALTFRTEGMYILRGQYDHAVLAGEKVVVALSGGRLSATVSGITWNMGTSFCLLRDEPRAGAHIAQSKAEANVYPADFFVSVRGGVLTVVASLEVEEYLCGVLPCEMGDSFALEALKAQAVAARTYTLRAMQGSRGADWDLVDTTADQAYYGTPSGSARCRQAVEETAGVAVRNGNDFTATYYTASNGGQTESIRNAWGTAGLDYLGVKDDPYDLLETVSEQRSFVISKSGQQANGVAGQLLSAKLTQTVGAGAVLRGVPQVLPASPRYASPSRLYTRLQVTVIYTRNGAERTCTLEFDIFGELEGPLSMSINSTPNELWSVQESESGFTVYARRFGHGIGMSQRGALQMARMGMNYAQILAWYYEGCCRVQYHYTGTAAPAQAGESDRSAPGAAATASVTADGGLNLRAEPGTGARVLALLQQGTQVQVLGTSGEWAYIQVGSYTGYVMTRFLSLSPEAVLPQATAVPPQQEEARVNTSDGGLNMRQNADVNSGIVTVLPSGATVTVLRQEGEWCYVRYDGREGYVMRRYLAWEEAAAQQPQESTPQESAPEAGEELVQLAAPVQARVDSAGSGALNLRAAPALTGAVLAQLPEGTAVLVTALGDTWCQVQVGEQTGFCMLRYLAWGWAD